jgi:hypothetical protein
LLLDGDKDVASLVVETFGRIIISNLLDGVTNDFLVVKPGLGSDFTKDHDHASLGGSLASNFGGRVFRKTGIKLYVSYKSNMKKKLIFTTHNGIGDLVANFI